MKVVVALPWRPQPGREAPHDFVCGWFAQVLPDAPLIEVDTDHDPYNLAAVRNKAVCEAEALGADVVVVSDADCVLEDARSLHRSIDQAAVDGRVHMPFERQRYLTEAETRAILAGEWPQRHPGHHGNGCCYVMTPDTYWRFGGSDERFSGWGGDDDQLVAAASCLVGLRRHRGVMLSLWHPAFRDVGSERHRPNAVLAHRYWAAIRSPEAMRALIAERDA